MDLADKIKFIRNEILEQTQENFASKIGVTRGTIKNWENGVSQPTVSHLMMISMIGDVSLDYLIFNDIDLQLSLANLDAEQYKIIKELICYFQRRNEG